MVVIYIDMIKDEKEICDGKSEYEEIQCGILAIELNMFAVRVVSVVGDSTPPKAAGRHR